MVGFFSRRKPVTIKEIIDRYVQYEKVPGIEHLVQTPESMKRAMREIAKAHRRGLLLREDGTPYPADESPDLA